jgi:hypothetical protein
MTLEAAVMDPGFEFPDRRSWYEGYSDEALETELVGHRERAANLLASMVGMDYEIQRRKR